ncbi:trypsin-like serine peptidase [Agromyces binzhouensis]|uniref:Serine protease n=1 Tax=Agromyces binzhouensis TaxID=1817495 RepID=A0A4Q2JED7_9MICO|nr:trypsin-like peptidase domain-containing protein [Agromyces binzhouensis]RXZ46105.1 serine protease [Agromyces binzhouensis]
MEERTSANALAQEPPAGADEFVRLDNERSGERMPKELAAQVEGRTLSITTREKFDFRSVEPVRYDGDRWQVKLPEGTGLVMPGRTSGRLSVDEVGKAAVRELDEAGELAASRPAWVDYEPHAKVSAPRTTVLRRLDGTILEPHYGVFGADDRQVYYPGGYPWTCVGKVYVWDDWGSPYPAWSGSGVLIGDRTVLTAGHMCPWGSGNWAMQFVPAYYDGVSTLGRGVSSYVSDYYGYDTDDTVSAWDMAVLRLYTPLGVNYGYFGTKDYNSAWEGGNYWTLAGYPGAVAGGNRPSRQMWWPVLDDDGSGSAEEVEYEADSTPGNSGGPVFGFWSGLPYAIATHSGGSKTTFLWWTIEDTNVGAGGGALNSLVAWARSNWPA